MLRVVLFVVLGLVAAFAAAVFINTPAGPEPILSRMELTAREALGLDPPAGEEPAPMMADARRRNPATNISAQDLAIITAAIREELREEVEAQSRQQLWQDVGLGLVFMIFGAMFGELGRGLRLT